MKVITRLSSYLREKKFNEFLALYQELIRAQELMINVLNCVLIAPVEVLDVLFPIAIQSDDDGVIAMLIYQAGVSDRARQLGLITACEFGKLDLMDRLIQAGIHLENKMIEEDGGALTAEQRQILLARLQQAKTISAVRKVPGLFSRLTKSRMRDIANQMQIWEKLSPSGLGEFVDDITLGHKDNPFTATEWHDFYLGLMQLSGEFKSYINTRRLTEYEYPQPSSTSSSSSSSSAELVQVNAADVVLIEDKSNELIVALITKLAAKELPNDIDLPRYFKAGPHKKYSENESIKLRATRDYLIAHDCIFDYFIENPQKLLERKLTGEQDTKLVLLKYRQICAEKIEQWLVENHKKPVQTAITATELPKIKNPSITHLPLFQQRWEVAVNNGDLKLMQLILNTLKQIQRLLGDPIEFPFNFKSANGKTAIVHAAKGGDLELVRELLGYYELTENKGLEAANAALLASAYVGHVAVVDFLLKNQQTNVNAKDEHGNTPLIMAAFQGNLPLVRLLLATKGVDVTATNSFGKTALKLAQKAEIINCIRAYFERENIATVEALAIALLKENCLSKYKDFKTLDFLILENQAEFPLRLEVAKILLELKDELMHPRLFSTQTILSDKLNGAVIQDPALVRAFVQAIINKQVENPFNFETWQTTLKLFKTALHAYPECAALQQYRHPDAPVLKLKDVIAVYRSSSPSSSSKTTPRYLSDEAKAAITWAIKMEFENTLKDVVWDEINIDAFAALCNPEPAQSPDAFLARQRLQQLAITICEKNNSLIPTYLEKPTKIYANLKSSQSSLALEYLREKIAEQLKELRTKLQDNLPEQSTALQN